MIFGSSVKRSSLSDKCPITSISSSDASSLLVRWNRYEGATNYFLDLRVINITNVAPVVVTVPDPRTQTTVHGLWPGASYTVTLKVTAIRLEWANVTTAQRYFLLVISTESGERYNLTFTGLSAVVPNLRPSTSYDCSIYTANAAGIGSSSQVRTVSTLVQPPGNITAVQTGSRTARIRWEPVKKVLLYRVVIVDISRNTRNTAFRTNVSTTTVDVDNILPCSSYEISVSSFNMFLVPGEPRTYTYTTNKLNPVESISVNYTCSDNSAVVSWTVVLGADAYRVEAKGRNGSQLLCTAAGGTSCTLKGVPCGQSYHVYVIAISNNCESASNITSAYFHSAPCSPMVLEPFRECSSNVIIFSWEANNYTDHYRARAESDGLEDIPCITTDTSCFFTNTICGRLYTFTVYAVSGQCRSEESRSVSVRTAPCQPQNLLCSADCATDVLISTWDMAGGAVKYSVEAFGNHNHSARYNCTSSTNSCAMPDVACGESLTTYITAFDEECPSERTLGEVAETVPCVPQNVSAVMMCGTDSVTLRWDFAGGAIFYMAMAIDSNGGMHTCHTMGTQCDIRKLPCGSTYEAYVIASNGKCNSSRSDVVFVDTAPCPPDQIKTVLDCAAGNVMVMWAAQARVTSYTASLVDRSGALLSCSSINLNYCRVTDIRCGEVYEVTVTHHDGICPSMPSRPFHIDSVPCGPSNTHAEVDCKTGVLSVGWNATVGADGYSTEVTSSQGERVQVNTTATQSRLDSLSCGESYTVEVRSFNGSCLSAPSRSLLVSQAPCVPTDVTVQQNCANDSVRVTWQASRGARRYTVVAISSSGRSECSSVTTTCDLTDLNCGQEYDITVRAEDELCSSMPSHSVPLPTTPCPPTAVVAQMSCTKDNATLSWSASRNAVSYTGTAVGEDGHTVTCDAVALSCQMVALRCGQTYTFTVSASDGTCASPSSQQYTLETAPCAPVGVDTNLDCATNVLQVGWSVAGSLLYSVAVTDGGGSSVGTCSSKGPSCTVRSLQCGYRYTVVVTASNQNCTGPASAPQTVNTAPCVPEDVSVGVECSTNDLYASWNPSAGALSYTGLLHGEGGFHKTCATSVPRCSFRDLRCAHNYTLQVVAHHRGCNSSLSMVVAVTTAPCEPDNVTVALHCPEGVASVAWSASAGARGYTVLARSSEAPRVDSCRTTNTTCDLTQLTCGLAYNITVMAGDERCNTPCPPVMDEPMLNCSTNEVYVSWRPANDAVGGVKVSAVSEMGYTSHCETPNNVQSCDLTDLECGQRYAVTAVARGNDCDSRPSRPFDITTAPCTPANMDVDYTCGTSIALLSWDDSLGRESFYTRVQSSEHVDGCHTIETNCALTSLRCGSVYNVSVKALASHCNSSKATTELETAPCSPTNVSASLVCADTSAHVTWAGTPGAVGYNVTAQARDGDSKECHSTATSCHLQHMHCHQTYLITVTPYTHTCSGFPSAQHSFVSGPCPPTDVSVSLKCNGNVGTVTWTAALAADLYVATATANDGHTHTCNSTGTSCAFTDLHCGERYAITVVTRERGCQSEPSQPVTLATGLCPPTNLFGRTSCETNDLTLSWDPSPVSGAQYILEHFPNVSMSTPNTSVVLRGLTCGSDFTFWGFARDSVCTSGRSVPLNISTAPCAPRGVTMRTTCGTSKGVLSWVGGAGATSYTATVMSSAGNASCATNSTSCELRLHCGQHYTATVLSSNAGCSSNTAATTEFDSAPCLPDGVRARVDCAATGSMLVQWQAAGSPDAYTAIAIGADGTRHSCSTSSTSCTVTGLRCGHVYGVAVTTSAVDCAVLDSDYQVQSAPCPPHSPAVTRDCSTNDAVVTWDSSGGQQDHVVTAVNFYGQSVSCNSSEPNCTFTGLRCGEEYTLSVVGHTANCSTPPSATVSFNTAPCVPTRVEGRVSCDTDITTVTWDSARGASSYTVYASSSSGHNTTCANHDAYCAFGSSDLQCGQDYTIVVEAHHDDCVSLTSQPINISTGPCPHSNLQVALNCSDNSAEVSWTAGSGIMNYNITAEGITVDHLLSSSTSGTSSPISGLVCGHRYRFVVAGQGRTCPSPAREWVVKQTAPCPPTDVHVASSCQSDVIAVSWTASRGSISYMAVAEGSLGFLGSCTTSGTACNITGLACGQTYQVYVAGIDDTCTGARSDAQMLQIAPCTPMDIQTQLECDTGLLNITWEQHGEASSYRATVTDGDGQVITCVSDEPACVVPSLPCGHAYGVSVVAQNQVCNSPSSPVHQIVAAPCPPDSIDIDVECTSGVVTVTWMPSVPGVLYTAVAAESCEDSQTFMCNSTGAGCSLSTLKCGARYNVTVVPSRDTCVGAYYPVQSIITAPCVARLLEVEMDCLSDSAWVMWEESMGAELYTAMATNSEGQSVTCNSTGTQCAVADLQCSRFYNFTVTASDWQCDSPPSNHIESETAPCAPEGVDVMVGCASRSLGVRWEASVGAVSYAAALEQTTGNIACCHSSDAYCMFSGLPCGQMYVVTVTAEGRTCNSSQSLPRIVRTVPCMPESLVGSVRCGDNVGVFSWSLSDGGQIYQVEAVSPDGHRASCANHEGQCEIDGLLCGQVYNASVVAKDSTCTSPPSHAVSIRTVPCMAQNVSLEVDCAANTLSVMWEESAGADSYTANVLDSEGRSTSCQIMTPELADPDDTAMRSCNVTSLACGQIYHVSVTASDGYCDSPPTDVINTHSGPCVPRHIDAVLDCESDSALLSWQLAPGAVTYRAVAQGSLGQELECQTAETTCELMGLTCGDSFTVTVHAIGDTCSSQATMSGQLRTGPCVPQHVTVQYSTSIGQVSWDWSRAAASYLVEAVTDTGLTDSCYTIDSVCALFSLTCSQTYNVTVTARNDVCQDLATSDPVPLRTEPCPPNNVQVHMECSSDSGVVSWEASPYAVGYEAVLQGRNGHTVSCTTAETSCTAVGLQCGTVYLTFVRALGETLNSSDSTAVLLVSAPCPPNVTSVAVDVYCEDDLAEISWDWSEGATSYAVEAISADSYRAECTSDGFHCNVTELECGQTYTLTLTTINENCQVRRESEITFQTRPCAPQRLHVDLQCGTSTAILTWEPEEDVELYMVSATSSSGGEIYCNTTDPSCPFPNLECGSTYYFTVTAEGSMCSSYSSATVEIDTEPCPPGDVTVDGMSCGNDSVVLMWSAAAGASSYSVTVTGSLGYVDSFMTNDTELWTELTCGQTFTFSVVTHGDRCLSPPRFSEPVTSTPCVPQDIQTYVECESDLGSVSWSASDGADFYTAIAMGQDGHTHVCTTNSSTCSWDDLHCGEVYVVQVIANDIMCTSPPSNITLIHMDPCIPGGLRVEMDCRMRVGTLTWVPSETAELYVVQAVGDDGHTVALSTSGITASISEFRCGQDYYLTVSAVGPNCTSGPSEPAVLVAEPCPPKLVSSVMDCVSNIAVVSWEQSAGGEYYMAVMEGEGGVSASCLSSGQSCGVSKLLCGESYDVTVIAANRQCNSTPSDVGHLNAVPCVPLNVSVDVDCDSGAAEVSWSSSKGAVLYRALGQSTRGASATCESVEPRCTLQGLTCGVPYHVQVVSVGDNCTSLPSHAADFQSVPCVPEITAGTLDCYSESVLLEWTYAEGVQVYHGLAQAPDGHSSTCTTNYTNCELAELHCGQLYTFTVVASDAQCSSRASGSMEMDSVPCPPVGLTSHVNCNDETALIMWDTSSGAESYMVNAIGWEGHVTGCNTTEEQCLLPELMCGYMYNITVTAFSNQCNVSESDILLLQSVPCIPDGDTLVADLDCDTGVVSVSWEPSDGASNYTVVADAGVGYASECTSDGDTVCEFSDLLCGMTYSITVSASDGTCSSLFSSSIQIDTVPCGPQNASVYVDCSDGQATVSWQESEGASLYSVQAIGPDGHRVQCQSISSSCQLPALNCGQLYNVTVTARDSHCNSTDTHLTVQSVPCVPTGLQTALRCTYTWERSMSVTWEHTSGAEGYIVHGLGADGHQVTCNASVGVTHCDLTDLHCGQLYHVSVGSVDQYCRSVDSASATVKTAPCPPQDVTVQSRCKERSIVITRADSPNDNLHVILDPNRGPSMSCLSPYNNCSFNDMPCGHSYTATVSAVKDNCKSAESQVFQVSTAPCVPYSFHGSLDCVTNSVWAGWEGALGAESYTALAVREGGRANSSCTTRELSCNVGELDCGVTYSFSLTASNGDCSTAGNTTFQIQTAPCALREISTETECHSNSIVVRWEMVEGKTMYVATAEGHDRSLLICNGTSTSCTLQDAQCGTEYTIIISTESDKCSSLRSPPKKMQTAPCAPTGVTTQEVCEHNGVVVSWDPSYVARSYSVTATGRHGDLHTCNSTVNNCTLLDLHCGQPYTITVTASNGICTSPPSNPVTFQSVPCDPENVDVELYCDTLTASLSWDSSEGADRYVGCAQMADGGMLYCHSMDTSCFIEGLHCGSIYNFSVQASNGVCNSSFSPPEERGAMPCPPAGVKVRVRWVNRMDLVMVSWAAVPCPDVEYLVHITGTIEDDPAQGIDVTSYWLQHTFFEMPLPCGTAFHITVETRNIAGTSVPSDAISGVTAPCAPTGFRAIGNESFATLTWNAAALATRYIVYQQLLGGRPVVCNTTSLTCNVTSLLQLQLTASNAAGESPVTTLDGTSLGRRRRDLRESQMMAGLLEDDVLITPEPRVTAVTEGTLQLEWPPVRGASYYTLIVREDMSSRPPWEVLTIYDEVATVTHLQPATRYCIVLSAKNSITQSPYSLPLCVTTGVSQ
ncbi:hypothetical protein ACEWY4_014958 [Coilia grayii]|uniref:Fibronectin type-III domain-containing protein n=1 Tax=Coilia grayii TaxID=363190 RepID=A0ABD1JTU7_9TELE